MNKILEILWQRIMHFGSVPLCNGIPSRAPHIFGFCFPLCYRCTFIFLFFLITLFYNHYHSQKVHRYILILCLIPMIVDGCMQTFWGIESTNIRRILTGSLFGFGLGGIVSYLYTWVDLRG